MKYPLTLLILLLIFSNDVCAQLLLKGGVVDADTRRPLAYVNIGIKGKNVGAAANENGSFTLHVPTEHVGDTLTFSLVGYKEYNVAVNELDAGKSLEIQLREKRVELAEVKITADRPVERKYGIKKRGLVHFTDGMFSENDVFEIGQLVRLGDKASRITSANLYISEARADSATFRVNFYRYNQDYPQERIVEKSVLQRHEIKAGWLHFDLSPYGIFLKGDFIVAIEFMPEPRKNVKQIVYEIKLGGSGKSFFRKNSLGKWNRPPHHYCLFLTALVDKNAPEQPDEEEALPAFKIYSEAVKDTFHVFVRLPKHYDRNPGRTYPVVYHLDGNAYFEHVGNAVGMLSKSKSFREPIVVGIGYSNAYVMDSLRNRDYTFPEAPPRDSFPLSGGGDKFYEFLAKELIPRIETAYRAEPAGRTIMGHSFGGYFTLYALLRDSGQKALFANYIAASPSLWYADAYLKNAFNDLKIALKTDVRIFISTGALEVDEDLSNEFEGFKSSMEKRVEWNFRSKVYPGLEHMGTAVPSFEDGLIYVLNGKH